MKGETKMAKRSSIGDLMRKKLSDITNTQPQFKLPSIEEKQNSFENFPTNKDCIEQLLKERGTLLQLLAERDKVIELSGAELQRLRSNIQKLQLQNRTLAQSNSHMLAELNLGRERIRALNHELLCSAALVKAKNTDVEGKVEIEAETNFPPSQEVEEKEVQPSPRATNEEKTTNRTRRRNMRSRSTGSTTCTTKKKIEHENKRPRLRRQSARFPTQEQHEALEDLFEIEDAKYPEVVAETCGLRNQSPRRSSIVSGRPSRKAAEKIHSYKEAPLNVKMRRED